MFDSDEYCADCDCASCVAIRERLSKPFEYKPMPPGHYGQTFTINIDDATN